MSFEHDNRDDPIVFHRTTTALVFTHADTGEVFERLELPALSMRRSEVSPEWLALHDAEQGEQTNTQESES